MQTSARLLPLMFEQLRWTRCLHPAERSIDALTVRQVYRLFHCIKLHPLCVISRLLPAVTSPPRAGSAEALAVSAVTSIPQVVPVWAAGIFMQPVHLNFAQNCRRRSPRQTPIWIHLLRKTCFQTAGLSRCLCSFIHAAAEQQRETCG